MIVIAATLSYLILSYLFIYLFIIINFFACTTFCQSKYTNSKMEEGDHKTIPTKDITNVEIGETALPNGFDNQMFLCLLI